MFREVGVETAFKDRFALGEGSVFIFELGFAENERNAVLV